MKKLMIAMAAMAMAGVVSAALTDGDPLVYDYKASVKHVYLKEVNIANFGRAYVKYLKTASLRGYLLVRANDSVGASVNTGAGPLATAGGHTLDGTANGFLVIMNRSADRASRRVVAMPAFLDARTFSSNGRAENMAQGYLFAEGTGNSSYELFGQFNSANWNPDYTGAAAAADFEDCWLNGAGVGKAEFNEDMCCGLNMNEALLTQLSGNLKGGIYLCSASGANRLHSDLALWVSVAGVAGYNGLEYDLFGVSATAPVSATWSFYDGIDAMATSDVAYGSWSIKINRRGLTPVALTGTGAGTEGGDMTTLPTYATYVKAAAMALDRNCTFYSNTEVNLALPGTANLVNPVISATQLLAFGL